MHAIDTMSARGEVAPSFVNLRTGERMSFEPRHNTLSFTAAEAMAAAFGGDSRFIPNRIGFIYGYGTQESIESEGIDRDQSWDRLRQDLDTWNADIQVVPFRYSPSLSRAERKGGDSSSASASSASSASSSSSASSASSASSSSSSGSVGPVDSGSQPYQEILRGGNAVTFHAHSDSQTPGSFGTCTDGRIFDTNMRIYQAALLNITDRETYVLARVSLKHGDVYLAKPDGFEVALDWTIKFF